MVVQRDHHGDPRTSRDLDQVAREAQPVVDVHQVRALSGELRCEQLLDAGMPGLAVEVEVEIVAVNARHRHAVDFESFDPDLRPGGERAGQDAGVLSGVALGGDQITHVGLDATLRLGCELMGDVKDVHGLIGAADARSTMPEWRGVVQS